jgi:hypothetical protein
MKRACAAGDEFGHAAIKQFVARQMMGGGIAGFIERPGPLSDSDHARSFNATNDGSGNDCRDRFAAMLHVTSQMHFCMSLQGMFFCVAGAA